jgi:hypothetical protein
MLSESAIDECRWLAVGFIVASLIVLFFRWRSGLLLTGVSGFHLHMCFFFGIGPWAYTVIDVPFERVWYGDLLESASYTGKFLLPAYLLAATFDLIYLKRHVKSRIINTDFLKGHFTKLGFLLAALSIIGYIGSTTEFATSGIGTIFPVLKLFQYPVIVLSVISLKRGRPTTALLLILTVAISGYFAIFSPWRSEVILLGCSFACGLILRNRRWFTPSIIFSCVLLFILLPFLQEKKDNYERVAADPLGVFAETLQMPVAERWEMVKNFWSQRINGEREVAFIQQGLETGVIELRGGETYWEALQQLVPRVIWPGKPSFNSTTGFLLPRQIGLVGWEDLYTSWGVSFFAELVWNFGTFHLLWAMPLTFFLIGKLDQLADKLYKRQLVSWLMKTTLFFQFFSIVGLVYVVTYILWIFLLGFLFDVFLDMQFQMNRTPVASMP